MKTKSTILFLLFVILMISAGPFLYACGNKGKLYAQKQAAGCCSQKKAPRQTKSCKCCEKPAKETDNHKCKGDCCGKSCHCATVNVNGHFALAVPIGLRTVPYFAETEHQFSPYTQHFLSSDFTSIWIPPKIS